eukprot:6633530-Pyramimonas_sp.AAC.1
MLRMRPSSGPSICLRECVGLRSRHLVSTPRARLFTPAHRSEQVIQELPPEERRIALGNADADRLAKHALSLHPQASPADLAELDRR